MLKFKSGQVLIELILALALSSVALVAMAQIAAKSVSNSGISKNRSDANQYAVQAVEWLRSSKNAMTWSAFYALNFTSCANTLPTTAASLTAGSCASTSYIQEGASNTIFKREITFTPVNSTQQTATIVVSWSEKGTTNNSTQSIIFKQY